MRISFIITFFITLLVADVFSQKATLDVAACVEWERLAEIQGNACLLSANGNFVMFKTQSGKKGTVTLLRDLKLAIQTTFVRTYDEQSFDNGRMFSFQLPGDSLVIFDSESNTLTNLQGVKRYSVLKSKNADWLAYITSKAGNDLLTLWNIKRNRKTVLSNVIKWWANRLGTILLVKTLDGLIRIDLNSLVQTLVTSKSTIENAALNSQGTQIAYITIQKDGYELQHFDLASGSSSILIKSSSQILKNYSKLEPYNLSFASDNDDIVFKTIKSNSSPTTPESSVITSGVNIWSWQDLYLQEKQLTNLDQPTSVTTIINAQTRKIVELESDTLLLPPFGTSNGHCVLTTRVNDNESYWNGQKWRMYLFSPTTGDKSLITECKYPGFQFIGFSPNGRFIIWFNRIDCNYYSYNLASGRTSNISMSPDCSFSTLNQRGQNAKVINKSYPFSGHYWLANGSELVVNARNDIWKLDPEGNKNPINLTNGYGDAKNIVFRLIDSDEYTDYTSGLSSPAPLRTDSGELLIWGFAYESKQNGFWKLSLEKPANPIKLVMSNDAYYFHPASPIFSVYDSEDPERFKPMKASNRKLFVIRKMNSSKIPNLFYTTNFKTFNKISNVTSDAKYGNVETKLITYKLPDGQQAEGVLHIPADINPLKKYPIIFNYYERRSEGLNVYRSPVLSGHNINIPWYVNRGYLIFEPDFYYEKGKTAKSIISCIEAAVHELKKLPYIDQTKMGIQGQSHGGYETNVIATGTNLFAAACEMAGYTNIISEYGSIRPGGYNNQIASDMDQRNLGVFPWDRPDVFIESSPVFHVGKMTTPLLMVHNKDDGAVNFSHAIELYLAARRLKKKVWLLQYDNEGHTIDNSENQLDFTIRMQQFFDHYLKGAPAPIWMTKGIIARDKAFVSGFVTDPSGICSETCTICQELQRSATQN